MKRINIHYGKKGQTIIIGGENYDKSRNYRSDRLCGTMRLVRLLLGHKDVEDCMVWFQKLY